MNIFGELKKSTLTAIWFIFLTFPILVIKVNTVHNTIIWRWENVLYIGIGTFVLSFFWRKMQRKRELGDEKAGIRKKLFAGFMQTANEYPVVRKVIIAVIFVVASILPFVLPETQQAYQINILTNALMYVVLGLGLNIVVGLAGLLDLGYVAFYAVGAYTYALLNTTFGLSFWLVLPIGAVLAALFGILLGFPVLRLRGDYLAIVTLGFGEIIRLILENWNDFSHGPSGVSGIEWPTVFGYEVSLQQSGLFLYFFMLVFAIFTIFVVNRLQNSRIGRAWLALREDEIACQAMGIDKTRTKLMAFALGATWAGIVGVIFAAKTTFINPASFTFMESAIILAIVVFGGMGSILGVIIAALILILLPEWLREIGNLRMIVFGGSMVLMMVFRPQGLISNVRRKYLFHNNDDFKNGTES